MAADSAAAPGTPERHILQAVASELSRVRIGINDGSVQNLLDFARGSYLDGLGALLGATRKEPTAAVTVLRFHRADGVVGDIEVEVGSRVRPAGGTTTFETTEAVTISAGLAFADVEAVATEAGVVGNGLLPGQLRQAVANLPGVGSIENVVTTGGGTDRETDEAFRARIPFTLSTYGTGGPAEAYRQQALAAHVDVANAAVVSPGPGLVTVCPIGVDGALLSQSVLDAVLAALDDETVRPICDRVEVQQPTVVDVQITLTWWGERDANARLAGVQDDVAAAVATYRAWQEGALGRDVTPSRLTAEVQAVDGVKRVEVDADFQEIGGTEIARASISVVYGGVEGP